MLLWAMPLLSVLTGCSGAGSGSGAEQILQVSAASSLTDALTQAGREFEDANPGIAVRYNFAASGVLQKQIEHGAPVDVFISASPQEMDALAKKGLLVESSRALLAGNTLVLIAAKGGAVRSWADLSEPEVRRVAISNPETVPSGRYARETLVRRGLWEAVSAKAVFGESVRQTLTYVANGDADAGIVFESDGRGEADRVVVADRARDEVDHARIVYPIAIVSRSERKDDAARLVAFLLSPRGQAILKEFGFRSAPE